jgi:hypothetical protein
MAGRVGLNVAVIAHDVAGSLPDIATLRERCRSLAVLEAILSPEEQSRYYSFSSSWWEDEEMASMDNGSGDAWSIVFSPAGAFVRGFDHESSMTRPGTTRSCGRDWSTPCRRCSLPR